jgi:hypothetical protein
MWLAPFSNGRPILSYEILHKDLQSDDQAQSTIVIEADGTTPQYVMMGLRPASVHQFSVRAYNAIGPAAEFSPTLTLSTVGTAVDGAFGSKLDGLIELPQAILIGVCGALFVAASLLLFVVIRYRISLERRVWCPPKKEKSAAEDEDAPAEEETPEEAEEAKVEDEDEKAAGSLPVDEDAERLARFFEPEEFVIGLDDQPNLVVNPVMLQMQDLHAEWERMEKEQLREAAAASALTARAESLHTARHDSPEASPPKGEQTARSLAGVSHKVLRAGAFKRLHIEMKARDEDFGNANLARLKKLQTFMHRQEGVGLEVAKWSKSTEAGKASESTLDRALATAPERVRRRRASVEAVSMQTARQQVRGGHEN